MLQTFKIIECQILTASKTASNLMLQTSRVIDGRILTISQNNYEFNFANNYEQLSTYSL
jgi:hypothetical protein